MVVCVCVDVGHVGRKVGQLGSWPSFFLKMNCDMTDLRAFACLEASNTPFSAFSIGHAMLCGQLSCGMLGDDRLKVVMIIGAEVTSCSIEERWRPQNMQPVCPAAIKRNIGLYTV